MTRAETMPYLVFFTVAALIAAFFAMSHHWSWWAPFTMCAYYMLGALNAPHVDV